VKYLTILCLALASAVSAETTPVQTVQKFYAAYGAGDLQAAAALWSRAEAPAFLRTSERHVRTRCLILEDLQIGPVQAGQDKTVLETKEVWTVTSQPGAVSNLETTFRTLELEHHDQWRIVRWFSSEEALAERAARLDAPQMRDLVAGAGKLRTPRLAIALARHAIGASNQRNVVRATAIVGIAREIATDAGDLGALSAVLGAESAVAGRRGEPDYEIALAEESLAFAEKAGEPDLIARALVRRGRANPGPTVMRAPFERVLAMEPSLADLSAVANAASQLSFASSEAHDRRNQLRYALVAVRAAEEGGADTPLYNAYYALAEAYWLQGNAALAIRAYLDMNAVARRAGYIDGVALSLFFLGGVYRAMGLDDQAEDAVAQGLATGDPAARVHLLYLRGEMATDRRDLLGAARDLEEAATISPLALAMPMVTLRILQNRHVEALEIAKEYRRNTRAYGVREQLFGAIMETRAYRKLKRFPEARASLAEGLRIGDVERMSAALDETQWSSFYAGKTEFDAEIVALALEAGDFGEAFSAAENMKARALRAFALPGFQSTSSLLTEEEERLERAVTERIVALNKRLLDPTQKAGQRLEVEAEIEKARLDLDALRARLAQTHARSLPDVPPAADPLVLAPQHVLVHYVSTFEGPIVIAAGPGEASQRTIIARRIEITPRQLKVKIDTLLERLENQDLRYGATSRDMYDLLLGPIAELLVPGATVCFVPDGDLWRVPFQALLAPGGKYLGQSQPMYYAPSLALGARERRGVTEAETQLLAFANPELEATTVARFRGAFTGAEVGALPDAQREVEEVAALYGRSRSRVYVGEDATEARLKNQSGRYGVIHFATHGAVDWHSPLASAMLLAPGTRKEDGLVEAREILELAIDADLAVLSACSTGAGRANRGEGIVGLSWAFLARGYPTTVVSQWKAESGVTSRLMIDFHRRLRKGLSPALALHEARIAVSRDPHYRHPFYWAPFVVVGSP
jgi:CHAT domain-containing protein